MNLYWTHLECMIWFAFQLLKRLSMWITNAKIYFHHHHISNEVKKYLSKNVQVKIKKLTRMNLKFVKIYIQIKDFFMNKVYGLENKCVRVSMFKTSLCQKKNQIIYRSTYTRSTLFIQLIPIFRKRICFSLWNFVSMDSLS